THNSPGLQFPLVMASSRKLQERTAIVSRHPWLTYPDYLPQFGQRCSFRRYPVPKAEHKEQPCPVAALLVVLTDIGEQLSWLVQRARSRNWPYDALMLGVQTIQDEDRQEMLVRRPEYRGPVGPFHKPECSLEMTLRRTC